MGRGGAKSAQKGERRCLIKGSGEPRAGLIRFTLDPDDGIVPDILERLGGRGVWLTADREIINEAIEKNLFARAFRKQVKIPDHLAENIEAGLVRQLIALLSMARKAGGAVSGADRVGEWLQNGKAGLLFQASDGSEREKKNLPGRNEAKWRLECLDRKELGMAFGRENVVHAALTGKGLANRVRNEANRLCGLRLNATRQNQELKANIENG